MPEKIDLSEALRQLRGFYRSHHRTPNFEEIRRLFGYKSKNAAFWLVRKLLDKGLVKKDAQGKLLFPSLTGIRVLGTVQAGLPAPAEEEPLDILCLDEFLVRNPDQSFLIKVTGDSMVDAGIHEGDLVIVERGKEPKSGDIVIAQVDGAWTLKKLAKGAKKPVLLPANKKYPPIHPSQELRVGGVVVGVIRRYR